MWRCECVRPVRQVRDAGVKQRLDTEETNVADVALAKNVETAAELIGIDPTEIARANFAASEVAEVASGVARVCDGDVAERRPAARDEAQHVPRLGSEIDHSELSLR